jgi:hypothetical protein
MMHEATTEAEKLQMQKVCIADHDYFIIKGITDVDKIRDEAYRRSQGLPGHEPESIVIHHHRLMENCYLKEMGGTQKHEVFGELK